MKPRLTPCAPHFYSDQGAPFLSRSRICVEHLIEKTERPLTHGTFAAPAPHPKPVRSAACLHRADTAPRASGSEADPSLPINQLTGQSRDGATDPPSAAVALPPVSQLVFRCMSLVHEAPRRLPSA